MTLNEAIALKKKVSVTLDEDVILEIKSVSEKNDRSFSGYINLVLKKHIQNYKNNCNK